MKNITKSLFLLFIMISNSFASNYIEINKTISNELYDALTFNSNNNYENVNKSFLDFILKHYKYIYNNSDKFNSKHECENYINSVVKKEIDSEIKKSKDNFDNSTIENLTYVLTKPIYDFCIYYSVENNSINNDKFEFEFKKSIILTQYFGFMIVNKNRLYELNFNYFK